MSKTTCLFISYLTILFAVYFLILTPLLYIQLEPKFPIAEKTAYRVGYWCTALAVYIIILIVSLLIVKYRKPRTIPMASYVDDYRGDSRDRLLDVNIPPHKIEEGYGSSTVEFRKTEPIYVNASPQRPQLNSIDIGCQTGHDLLPVSPMTPREKYFFDMMKDGHEPQRYSSTPPRGPYLNSKLFTEDDLYTNHKDLHRFLTINDRPKMTEDQIEAQRLLKVQDRFLKEERRQCGYEEPKRSSKDFYYVPPPNVVQKQERAECLDLTTIDCEERQREILKSEIFISVSDDSDGKKKNVEKEIKLSINEDDVFY